MQLKDMTISERWRWRLLAIWVVIFTVLVVIAMTWIRNLSEDNRDALCAIHRTHLTTDKSLKLLLEKGGLDVEEIIGEIRTEEAALRELAC